MHKLFSYLGAVLLATAAIQCKCAVKPSYDTTKLELQWEKEENPLEIAGLDVEKAEGTTCHVPSEEAVYFLRDDGKFWRFTISPAGGLTSELMADLDTFALRHLYGHVGKFIFAAGSKEKQVLYAGAIDGNHIMLWNYTSRSWQRVSLAKSHVDDFFSDFSAAAPIACTLEADSQLRGCLILQLFDRSMRGYAKGRLIFNPTTQNFDSLQPMPASGYGDRFVTAVRQASGTVLASKYQYSHSSPTSFYALSVSNDSLEPIREIKNTVTADRWETFSLRATGEFPTSEPIFAAHKKDVAPSFHKLTEDDQMVPTGSLSIESVGNSLVLPFSNVVYVVTTIQGDGEKKLVTYRGKLQLPAE